MDSYFLSSHTYVSIFQIMAFDHQASSQDSWSHLPSSQREFEDDYPGLRLDWWSKATVNVSYTKQGLFIY